TMMRIDPGATIGIIGGGQLGRMLAVAASRLGYRTHVFTPETDSPAQQVASETTIAAYDDIDALRHFAQSVAVVTYEFENIPHACLSMLEKAVTVSPSADILRLSQHRGREKAFLRENGIAIAPYAFVQSAKELEAAIQEVGPAGVLKTAEFGYDGKGQIRLTRNSNAAKMWEKLGTDEAVYEGFVDFECEISVIVARNEASGAVAYPPVQNIHVKHILDTTIAPAPISKSTRKKAEEVALKVAEACDLRGLLAVEMFVTRKGEVLVNELAPRPHNSGHWTLDACVTDQFEQAIRAICGLPLGSTRRLYNAVMKNLIGEEVNLWHEYVQEPNAKVHLYGKKEIREGRKMGHVTRLGKKAKAAKFAWGLKDGEH
ncbi:MAG: 5-(carboxyamino)imidazole ribonucleotide synthase, partial [Rickettsiales bacterium]